MSKYLEGELDFTKQDKEDQQRFLDSVIITVRKIEGPEWFYDDPVEYFVNFM